jgi:hypothetical protein
MQNRLVVVIAAWLRLVDADVDVDVDADLRLAEDAALYRHLETARPAVALARMQAEMQGRPMREWAGLVFYGNE